MKTIANTRRDGCNFDYWDEVMVLPSVVSTGTYIGRYQDDKETPNRSFLPAATRKIKKGGSAVIGKAIDVIKETAHEHGVPCSRASKVQRKKGGFKSASNFRDEILRGKEIRVARGDDGMEELWKFSALNTAIASTYATKDLVCENMNEVTVDGFMCNEEQAQRDDESSYYSSDEESTVFSEARGSYNLCVSSSCNEKKEEKHIPTKISGPNETQYVSPKYVLMRSRLGKGMTYRVPTSVVKELEENLKNGTSTKKLSPRDLQRMNIVPWGYNDENEFEEEEVRE